MFSPRTYILCAYSTSLEDQSIEQMSLERECLAIQCDWKVNCKLFEDEIDKWKRNYEVNHILF